ncbi:flagellin [Photobacterium satsumensis]|uniref:flagellin n=1 Tax=Photobacterium satsumensis TaxID=2910239 RepID=UPI003D121282
MSVTVNTNVSAMTAQRHLGSATNNVSSSMERLSSGLRINSAKDDAAGLQISNRLTSQTNGLNVAMRNANDGISMAQTAEGAMQESTNIMQRMRDLSLQSANGSNSTSDREAIQKEVDSLQEELNRIADTTSFGGQKLLDGSYGTQDFQIGANSNETQSLELKDVSAHAIGRTYQSFDGSGTTTATVANGDSSAAGSMTLDLGNGNSTDITLNEDMTADDLANKINNVSGISDVKVTGNHATQTIDAMGAITGAASLDINGAAVDITDAADTAAVATAIQAEIDNGNLENVSVSEAGGTLTLTALDGSTDLDISADLSSATAGTLDVGSSTVGFGNSGGETAQAVSTASSFNIDFSGAKLNEGMSASVDGTAMTLAAGTTTDSVAGIDVTTEAGSQSAVDVLDAAIAQVDEQRADLGAFQNRMNHTLNNLANVNENVNASNSRIKDVDFAKETTDLTKNQILQQASTSILAQAKMNPQAALSLL